MSRSRAPVEPETEATSLRRKTQFWLGVACLAGLCSPLFAASPANLHRTVHRRRHLWSLLWHPMFRPSHQSLLAQNAEIDRLELPRIQDDKELEQLKASEALVPIRISESLRFDPRLDPTRRFSRPWTRDFTEDVAQAYYNRFHQQIQVNSAVRTVKVQKKLRRHNRNAAPAEGDTASSHLAGVTVDLQRRGMSKEQIRWMEHYLFYMKALGLVEPEEERHQWVFHIMVSGHYSEWRETQNIIVLEGVDHPESTPAPIDSAEIPRLTRNPLPNLQATALVSPE
jgi:hypothetical protein